uniref:Orf117 n=1 Tax=Batis maritima TaxID=4436 RepID=A0A068BHN4_BATMA|nr:orf117 [Batis maritima]AIC83378.1 orf117 [Batis maritima]
MFDSLFHYQVGKISKTSERWVGYGTTLGLGPRSRYGNTSEEGNTIIRARKAYHEKTFYEVRIETTISSLSKRSQLSHPTGKRIPRVRRLPCCDRGCHKPKSPDREYGYHYVSKMRLA